MCVAFARRADRVAHREASRPDGAIAPFSAPDMRFKDVSSTGASAGALATAALHHLKKGSACRGAPKIGPGNGPENEPFLFRSQGGLKNGPTRRDRKWDHKRRLKTRLQGSTLICISRKVKTSRVGKSPSEVQIVVESCEATCVGIGELRAITCTNSTVPGTAVLQAAFGQLAHKPKS